MTKHVIKSVTKCREPIHLHRAAIFLGLLLVGFEALPEIVETGVKIVVYTLDDAPEIRREVLSRGAHGYVAKSGPITDLIAEIQRVLRI